MTQYWRSTVQTSATACLLWRLFIHKNS